MPRTCYADDNSNATNGVVTTIFSLTNVTISALNINKLVRKHPGRRIAFAGIVTGLFQTGYGAFMIQEYNLNKGLASNVNNNAKTLGNANVLTGIATVVCSSLNMALNHNPKKKVEAKSSYINHRLQVGICYTRTF